MTRLFCRTTWIKLHEIDAANIDYHSIQNLDINENQTIFNDNAKTSNNMTSNLDVRMYEQYLGFENAPSIQDELNNPMLMNPDDPGS